MKNEFTTTEAQRRAKKNWQSANRKKSNYYSAKSTAKRFINELATLEDLAELEKFIKEKLK